METIQLEIAKKNFTLSFSMFEEVISISPEELWKEKQGGFVYWQQLLHVLTGINYWMRQNNDSFTEPFADRKLYPELEQDPESNLSKEELLEYLEEVKLEVQSFFEGKDDHWLHLKSPVCDQFRNLEIVYGQIRHIQYHIGHCEAILRQNNYQTAEWHDY